MEPTNHPFRKENDLNQTSMIMVHVNLPGCRWLFGISEPSTVGIPESPPTSSPPAQSFDLANLASEPQVFPKGSVPSLNM